MSLQDIQLLEARIRADLGRLVDLVSLRDGAQVVVALSSAATAAPAWVNETIGAVVSYTAVPVEAIMGRGRRQAVAIGNARAIAMAALRRGGLSFPEVGRAIGRRHHTTVLRACQRVARSPELLEAIDEILTSMPERAA